MSSRNYIFFSTYHFQICWFITVKRFMEIGQIIKRYRARLFSPSLTYLVTKKPDLNRVKTILLYNLKIL